MCDAIRKTFQRIAAHFSPCKYKVVEEPRIREQGTPATTTECTMGSHRSFLNIGRMGQLSGPKSHARVLRIPQSGG